jgi:hypothetical protein
VAAAQTIVVQECPMTDFELPEPLVAYTKRVQERIGWILDGNYAQPDEVLEPFVLALLKRAIDGDDEDVNVDRALEALRKLFPPRMQ